MFFSNLNGFASHSDEHVAYLELLDDKPTFVALNETKLDKGTLGISLPGYELLSRRDRCDGRTGGGVACFVRRDKASSAVLLEHSKEDERSWHLLHTAQGLFAARSFLQTAMRR